MTPDQSRGIPDDAALVEPYPDERICTTCKGRGAVLCQGDCFPLLPLTDHNEHTVSSWYEHCLSLYGVRQTWQVDACPECGRGGEVGRL